MFGGFHQGELPVAPLVRLLAVKALEVPVMGMIVFEVVFSFVNFWEHESIGLRTR